MLTIQVTDWSAGPKVAEAPEPDIPQDENTTQVRVVAAGLHQLVKSRASGQHYSSGPLPHTPGIDGTGIDCRNGRSVYFSVMGAGNIGSFTEILNLPKANVVEIPDGVDMVQAAALVNPVMASYMALSERVDFLRGETPKPWTCLIIGVTTMSGRLAVKVAREKGATKVIGAARNEAAMQKLNLDSRIVLQNEPESTDFALASDVDVILDFLHGPWPKAYLTTTKTTVAQTWVSIGSLAGMDADIPASALRSRNLTIRGSGPGAWPVSAMLINAPGMLKVLQGVHMDEVNSFPLKDIDKGWKAAGRVVFETNTK